MTSTIKATLVGLACWLCMASASAGELEITHATVRLVPPVASATAAYATLSNRSAQALEIRQVTVNPAIADSAAIHDMQMHDGMMSMKALAVLNIPAGDQVQLQPGGKHIMLEGLKHPLKAGQTIELTLIFNDGSRQSFTAVVTDMRHQAHHHH